MVAVAALAEVERLYPRVEAVVRRAHTATRAAEEANDDEAAERIFMAVERLTFDLFERYICREWEPGHD